MGRPKKVTHKLCLGCKEEVPIEKFGTVHGKVRSRCKPCLNLEARDRAREKAAAKREVDFGDFKVPRDWVPLIVWPDNFYKQQRQFIKSDAWQTVFLGGNGTGKTHVVYWSVAAYALGIHPKQFAPPPLRICCLVPDFDKVTDVALEKLLGSSIVMPKGLELGPLLPKSTIKKGFNKDHRAIDLKNGSSIIFVTDEQGWKAMRGKQYDALALDEESSKRVVQECKRGLRNAKGGGKIIMGFTPPFEEGRGPTWSKDLIDSETEDDNLDVFKACMMDNPAITEHFITEFTKGMTKEQVRNVVYGDYPAWGDLVHADFEDWLWDSKKMSGHLIKNDTEMPKNHEVEWVMAFDWHQSKPCAAVFGFLDRAGNITIFDELDKDLAKDKTIDELATIFKNIEGYPFAKRKFQRWQDPSAKSTYGAVQRGFNAWDAFRKSGIITSAGKNRDPDVGISIVNDYLRGNQTDHPRLFIYERCKHLRKFLTNHFWKRGADGVGKPDPKWSDYPITLRYILQEVGWKATRKKKWPLNSFTEPGLERRVVNIERWL